MKLSDLEKDVAVMKCFGTQEIRDGSVHRCAENVCDQKATQFTTMKIRPFKVHLIFCDKHAEQISHSIYCMPEPDEIPEAEVYLEVSDDTYLWILDKCPYCFQRHTHGGGKVGEDDPYKQLTHRVAHCGDPFREIAHMGYELVESEEEPSARGLAKTLINIIENSDDSCKDIIADFVAEQIKDEVSSRLLSAVMRQYQALKVKSEKLK